MNIIITGAGGPAGSSLIKQLNQRGIKPIALDLNSLSAELAELCEAVYESPSADHLDLIPFVLAVAKRHSAELIIPTVQEELPIFAACKTLFTAKVVIASADSVALAHDKLFTQLALEKAQVSVPRTYASWEIRNSKAELPLPLIAKPRVSRGGRGVEIISSKAELEAKLTEANLIFQEFASGEEYCPQVFISPDGQKNLAVVLKKTALKQGDIGNAAAVERVENEQIAQLALKTAKALNLTGALDIDIRLLANSQPVVLEVNARFGANSAAAPELLEGVLHG